MAQEILSIGDTGQQLVNKFNGNFSSLFFAPLYFIENYAEEGDVDDTLAFQRCIDAMPDTTSFQSGGGIIMLSGKKYVISDTILCDKSIKIMGAGSDSGTMIWMPAQSNCNMFEFGKRNSSDPISVHLIGMRIGMDVNQTGACSNVVCYNYLRHSHFMDLFIAGATAANFRMIVDNEGGTSARNSYFYGCAFEYGKVRALDIVHGYNLNINSCYFGFGTDNDSWGLYIDQTAPRLVVSNCWFLQDSQRGNLFITGATYVHVVNNHFSGIDGVAILGSSHIYIGTCAVVQISGNTFANTLYPYAIRVAAESTSAVKIHDNFFGSVATAYFLFATKANVICHDNTFFTGLQNNKGLATIANGQTYVEVTHGIFTTPDSVFTTPRGNEAVWVSDIGATVFRINRAGSSGDLVCNWLSSIATY